MKCDCCGEAEFLFLTLDHPNNDGSQHRKAAIRTARQTTDYYVWLKKNNYPIDLRVLCMNCNWGRMRNKGGPCPHELQRAALPLAA